MLNCPALLFGIVCTQQNCILLEYCTRLTYSKVFHFLEMWYAWCFPLLSWSFPQFTMLNCTGLLFWIVHSQQSYVSLEYVICLMYSKVFHFFAVLTIYYAKLPCPTVWDSLHSTELYLARILY